MAGGGWSPTPVTCWTWRQSGFSINLSQLSMCVLEWPAVGVMVLMVLMMWEDWSQDWSQVPGRSYPQSVSQSCSAL